MNRSALILAGAIAISSAACSTTSDTRESAKQAETFPLKYVDAESTAEQLRTNSGEAQILADLHTNSIVVAGTEAQIEKVRRSIERIDVEQPR